MFPTAIYNVNVRLAQCHLESRSLFNITWCPIKGDFRQKKLSVQVFNSGCIQLFRERLLENMCTRQSRKVIWDMINTLFLTL